MDGFSGSQTADIDRPMDRQACQCRHPDPSGGHRTASSHQKWAPSSARPDLAREPSGLELLPPILPCAATCDPEGQNNQREVEAEALLPDIEGVIFKLVPAWKVPIRKDLRDAAEATSERGFITTSGAAGSTHSELVEGTVASSFSEGRARRERRFDKKLVKCYI